MTDKLIVLKNEKPLLFKILLLLLALPLAVLLIVSIVNPALRSWLVSSAKALMEETKRKDQTLVNEIDEAQKKIDKLEEKIENVNEQLNTLNSDADADWHKKVKK